MTTQLSEAVHRLSAYLEQFGSAEMHASPMFWSAYDTLCDAVAAAEAAPPAPPECQTEGEKRAYAFGWWQGVESARKETGQGEQK